MMLDRQPILLEPVLRHVVDELRTTWPKRTIEAEFHLLDPVDCNTARLSQILSNLLANALTHGSPEGAVHVRAFLEQNLFELSVTNSGRPIPPEALEKLFQPLSVKMLVPVKMLSKYINELTLPVFYIGGPQGMVVAMRKVLNETGVDDDNIRTEEFSGY